jgi:hypothetical protein
VRLSSTLYLILKFAIVPRQLPDDDIRPARHTKGAFKKYGIANFEFVVGHGTVRTRQLSGAIISLQRNTVRGRRLPPPKKEPDEHLPAGLSSGGNTPPYHWATASLIYFAARSRPRGCEHVLAFLFTACGQDYELSRGL